MKTTLVATGEKALGQFAQAKDNLSNSQFDKAAVDFSESYQILSDANRDITTYRRKFQRNFAFRARNFQSRKRQLCRERRGAFFSGRKKSG